MALESQGIKVRRASSVETTYSNTGLCCTAGSTHIICDHATADFLAAGFSSGMRLVVNSSLNTAVLTIKGVSATKMSIHEPVVQHDATFLELTAYTMSTVGEVVSFTGPGGAAAILDVSNLGSPAKEKLMGIRDEGQVSMEIYLNTCTTAQHIALKNDRADREKRIFDIVLTDEVSSADHIPSYLWFEAYVTNFSITGAVDQAIKGSITLEVTSAVQWRPKV